MGAPADIGQEAGGVAVAALVLGFGQLDGADERSVHSHSSSPWRGRAGAQQVEVGCRRDERIGALAVAVELVEQQALADAERGDRDLPGLPHANDLFEHHGAVGEERPARLGDLLDILQGLGIDPLDQLQKIEAVLRAHGVAMHHMERVIPGRHVELGERAPGTADRIEGAASQARKLVGRTGERIAHDLLRLLQRVPGQVLRARPPEGQVIPSRSRCRARPRVPGCRRPCRRRCRPDYGSPK
jgi:hypothetical protein